MFMDMSFNTSHVNVYLKQREESEGKRSFNTSYVNVYPQGGMVQNRIGGVSIHPMLMFIQRISAISKNNYTNFSSIYQLFSIFYQPITHFIVFK